MVILCKIQYFSQDCAAVIIGWEHNQRRRIIIYGADSYYVNYMHLDPASGWSYMQQSQFRNNYMQAVSLSRWEHYLMGGLSNGFHGDNSAR